MINEPPPLNVSYNGDPDIKALKRKRFINHRSTLGGSKISGLESLLGEFSITQTTWHLGSLLRDNP